MFFYGQVNSILIKSSAASKWATKHLWGYICFADDDTYAYILKHIK